ncbi:2-succinyl-5-enolpyruvyl-6-hydroxy-3-cyclohexene-1-carboxylic-acid synthase [Thalassobacillus devorans]|uniref:2-succinyl-5-enolpyruvyl-6-hydroxy-3- cyclohexene-1-carboxylic-acid synthase n=1 Tax=Thalassobacillus devorans TaxID=279813 RepID=UPI00048AF59A|nr:2-succinyl-5-enolpyruvyl-6-hydroxy-3-cyclohexene-1-carboxylic-acid synthase [Thalassobacillus devorans]
MEHTETLTRYMAKFVQGLVEAGVQDVVISPGSRSTPIAMTCAEYDKINHWVNLDERSAAFFALGMAKEQRGPVALVCTSGTAAANYYPAVIEAFYSRVPLIVLTADRPHELRDVGAPQAIEQLSLYGDYVKWFHDLALPEGSRKMLRYARTTAGRAVQEAVLGNDGPVHINLPLREPLIPDFSLPGLWEADTDSKVLTPAIGKRGIDRNYLDSLIKDLKRFTKGVIVCGPQMDAGFGDAIAYLAKRLGAPVLADPLSQLRANKYEKNNIIETYDAILKHDEIKGALQPEFIIRFGAMPVSKPYLQWLTTLNSPLHLIVEQEAGYREPAGIETAAIYADPVIFAEQLAEHLDEPIVENRWLETWKDMNRVAKDLLLAESPEEGMNEGHAVVQLAEVIPDQSILYVGNSMPIRDVDTFFMTTPKEIDIMANRGANGIDGVVSAALGTGARGKPVTLLIGDLSFFHDMNGLLIAKQKNLNITIVLINNDGGGIFSYLPQASHPDHYEELFGTPMGIEFQPFVEAYGGAYHLAKSWNDYTNALANSYASPGLSVIEVRTVREENVPYHKAKWESVKEAIGKQLKG